MRKREGTSGVIAIKIARDSNALSVLANSPHFEGIGAIKMVLSGFLHCRFSKNQWVRSSCKFALCQPTQFLVGENIRYLLNERSTSLFSYQLHMAVSCENGGFFGHHYWLQQFHEQYARRTTSLNIVTHLDREGCRQWLLAKAPEKTVYIRVYIIKNRIRNKPASMRH